MQRSLRQQVPLVLLLVALPVASSAKSYRFYPGPLLVRSQVAYVELCWAYCGLATMLDLPEDLLLGREIGGGEFRPGRYTFSFTFKGSFSVELAGGKYVATHVDLSGTNIAVDLSAGHNYVVTLDRRYDPGVGVVDPHSRIVIVDVANPGLPEVSGPPVDRWSWNWETKDFRWGAERADVYFKGERPVFESAEDVEARLRQPPASTETSGADFTRTRARGSYQELVERYRRGDREAAIAEVAGWSEDRLASEIRHATASTCNLAVAALLHTDCALRAQAQSDLPGFGRQLEAARRLVDGLPKGSRMAARWCLATGYHLLGRALDPRAARSLLVRGAKSFPDDAEIALAIGTVAEMEARMMELAGWRPLLDQRTAAARSGSSGQARGGAAADRRTLLVSAEGEYRRALTLAPELAEVHLRRGRVLALLGRASGAESELDWVVAHTQEGPLLYLAHLFRGRIQQEAGRLEASAASYRLAVAQDPGCQVGNLALGQVLDRLGERASAVDALRKAATAHEHDDSWWLYFYGRLHRSEALFDALRQEVTR